MSKKRRKCCWKIIKDHLRGGDEGTVGPRGCKADDTGLVRFKMYDDDNVLYYSGVMSDVCQGFEPLDDFGMPNAGCTGIQMKHRGYWEWV